MFRLGKHYIITSFLTFAALCSQQITVAQKITAFQRSYGGQKDDWGASILKLADNGYIVSGRSDSYSANGKNDILLIRTDSLGKVIWSKTYGGSADEGVLYYPSNGNVDVLLALDSNIVVCSTTESYGAGGRDVYFFKINLNGNVMWDHTYGGQADDEGINVIVDPNGGYIISGETFSYGAGKGDVLLVKTDTAGKLIWSKAYGSSQNEECGYKITSARNGNLLISGYSYSTSTLYNQLVIKVDKNGNLIWSKIYGTQYFDQADCAIELPDKSIYLTGFTYNQFNGENTMGLVTKLDSNGKMLWSKMYDQNNHSSIYSAYYDPKKNIINAGMAVFQGGTQQIGFLRLDTSGNIKILRTFGKYSPTLSYSAGFGHNFLPLASGGFILEATTQVFGFGGWDYYFLKLDSVGNPTDCQIHNISLSPTLFTSYMQNLSYIFASSSISPSVGSGMTVETVTVGDSLICAPFVAGFGSKSVCIGQTTFFFDSSYYGPTSWLWNFGDPASASNTSTLENPTHIYVAPGAYTVKLVSSNGNYRDSITHTVIVLPKNSQLKTMTTSFCPGDSVNLNADGTGGVTYSWSPGSLLSDSTDSSVWAHPKKDTTFVVTIKNSAGCTVEDSFIVNLSHLSPISLGGNRSSCTSPIALSPGPYPGLTYLWSTGDNSDTIYVNQSGKYWVRVNKGGCTASDTAIVTILAPAEFDNDNLHNAVFCSDDSSLTLDAGTAYRYLWSPGGDTTRKIQVAATGTYTVQITAPDGCNASETIAITDQCTPYLFVPDVFTPNGDKDKLNDQFKPVSRYPLQSYTMQIYNRWGERLFQSNDINIGWDGTFIGWDGVYKEPRCPEGVYLYVILYKFYYEIEQMKSGTVTLLR